MDPTKIVNLLFDNSHYFNAAIKYHNGGFPGDLNHVDPKYINHYILSYPNQVKAHLQQDKVLAAELFQRALQCCDAMLPIARAIAIYCVESGFITEMSTDMTDGGKRFLLVEQLKLQCSTMNDHDSLPQDLIYDILIQAQSELEPAVVNEVCKSTFKAKKTVLANKSLTQLYENAKEQGTGLRQEAVSSSNGDSSLNVEENKSVVRNSYKSN